MGAYGNVTCECCGESYYELDEHECDIDALRQRIREFKERIPELRRQIEEII